MRVLLVSAAYFPDHCGVGDYARHLANRLAARRTVEMAVLTASPGAEPENPGPQILRAWGGRIGLGDVWRAVARFRPDLVHIQYPTLRWCSPLVPAFVRRVLRTPVVQTWHEHGMAAYWGLPMMLLLTGLDGLIHVRADLLAKLPARVQARLRRMPVLFTPNGRTIPAVRLAAAERAALRSQVGGGAPLVAFFGLVYPNKGAHLLFEIADPAQHHLVLICELDPKSRYQRGILERAQSVPWRGRVTVTGFVPAEQAGRLLAAADAVVFPFPEGIGPWNTSVNAALSSGSLVVATASEGASTGYDPERNLYLAPPGDLVALKTGLARHLGERREPDLSDDWERIAEEHERFYARYA
jgi:glycosyltransferase involved in cell wall biosynthesis